MQWSLGSLPGPGGHRGVSGRLGLWGEVDPFPESVFSSHRHGQGLRALGSLKQRIQENILSREALPRPLVSITKEVQVTSVCSGQLGLKFQPLPKSTGPGGGRMGLGS